MQEAGVVIGWCGDPIFWHIPGNRQAGYLPDSRNLWNVLWENRDLIQGFAHSHPGSGVPSPSSEDLSTFKAVEKALGRRLVWWIVSSDSIIYYLTETGRTMQPCSEAPWVKALREVSSYARAQSQQGLASSRTNEV